MATLHYIWTSWKWSLCQAHALHPKSSSWSHAFLSWHSTLSRFLFNFINGVFLCVLISRAETPPVNQQWVFWAFWLDLRPLHLQVSPFFTDYLLLSIKVTFWINCHTLLGLTILYGLSPPSSSFDRDSTSYTLGNPQIYRFFETVSLAYLRDTRSCWL